MVKRVLTSIITVAVLMGSVVACGGSDSEVAELRAELEEVKAELDSKEAPEQQPNPPPTPTPIPVETEATHQSFFEYPKYGIAIDFFDPSVMDKFSRLVDCQSDWESLSNVLELIESEAGYEEWEFNPDIQHIGSTYRNYLDIWATDNEGIDLISRLIPCYTEFGEVFGPFTRFGDQRATPTLIYEYLDSCATVDQGLDNYSAQMSEDDKERLALWDKCTEVRPNVEIDKVNRAFKEINEWSNEVLAVLDEE